jgi:hypothetical protein
MPSRRTTSNGSVTMTKMTLIITIGVCAFLSQPLFPRGWRPMTAEISRLHDSHRAAKQLVRLPSVCVKQCEKHVAQLPSDSKVKKVFEAAATALTLSGKTHCDLACDKDPSLKAKIEANVKGLRSAVVAVDEVANLDWPYEMWSSLTHSFTPIPTIEPYEVGVSKGVAEWLKEIGSPAQWLAQFEADDDERRYKEENAKWAHPIDVAWSVVASINWHIWFCVLSGVWFFCFCNNLAIEFCKAFCKRLLGMGATAASKKETNDAIAQLTEQLQRAQDSAARAKADAEAVRSTHKPEVVVRDFMAGRSKVPERWELIDEQLRRAKNQAARAEALCYRGMPSSWLASESRAPLCSASPSTNPLALEYTPTAPTHASDFRDEIEREQREPVPALTNAAPTLGAMLDEGLITYFD